MSQGILEGIVGIVGSEAVSFAQLNGAETVVVGYKRI